jgi:hypothetical protein
MRKTLRLLLALVMSAMVLVLSAQGAEPAPADAPPPPVPSDVQLRNGVTLHKVSVVRWEKDHVVLKHAGGADPIRYVDLADSQKAAIMARGRYELTHPAAPKTAAGAPVVAADPVNQPVVYQGVVYVPTVNRNETNGGRPTNGLYKFSGVTVYAFPLEALKAFDGAGENVDLPKPLATAVTNQDGIFLLTVPPGVPHFLYCQAQRIVPSGKENCAWRLPAAEIKNPTAIELSTRYRVPYRQLRIAQ